MTSAPTPIAHGTLSKRPLIHVVLSIHHRRLTGTLAVWPEPSESSSQQGQDRLFFRNGMVRAAHLLKPAARLEHGILPLFHRQEAAYAFYESNLVGQGNHVQQGQVHTYALVAAALRGGAGKDAITKVIEQLSQHRQHGLRITPGSDMSSYHFTPQENAVIDLIRASPASPMTAKALIRASGDPRTARRVLYLLSITQTLVTVDLASLQQPSRAASSFSSSSSSSASKSPSRRTSSSSMSISAHFATTPGPMPSFDSTARFEALAKTGPLPVIAEASRKPPASLSQDAKTLWKKIVAFTDRIDAMTYFDMLGVDETASSDAIRDAYVEHVKQLHPDRLPPDLDPVREQAVMIFRHLTKARDTLLTQDKRQAYINAVAAGGGTPKAERKIDTIVTAAIDFQKVEILVRQRKWSKAITILDTNIEVSPTEPDYPAMKAWVLLQQHGTTEDAPIEEMLAHANQALALRSDHERALFTKATLLKHIGRTHEALECFRHVSRINPKNIEAQREVRLAQMRASAASEKRKSSSGNFFTNLFKKDLP